ncbi:MAG: type II secretion system protein, partial [Planctomycetes bacterium]|nr:type II secretion system protein [Planctomycetota bacterium]
MRRPSRQASGFTLIELLAVISIIALLASLTWGVWAGAVDAARAANTRALIAKLDRGLKDRLASFHQRPITVQSIDLRLADDGSGVLSAEVLARAQVIAKKRVMKEEFPQSWGPGVVGDFDPVWVDFNLNGGGPEPGEYLLPSQVSAIAQGYRSRVAEQANQGLLSNHDPATTSAECLYLILTQGPGSSAVDPTDFPHREVEDTDGDGLPEFIDGWGNPIRFYRWPTHFPSAVQKGDGPYRPREAREDDPMDPNRLLAQPQWWNAQAGGLWNIALSFSQSSSGGYKLGAAAFPSLFEPTAPSGLA